MGFIRSRKFFNTLQEEVFFITTPERWPVRGSERTVAITQEELPLGF